MNRSAIILLAIIYLAGLSFTASAQTEAGNVMFSGITSFMFSSSSTKDADNYGDKVKTSTMELSPQIGIFYYRNCLIGFALQYNSSKLETSTSDYNSSTVLAMPVLMYYFGKEQLKPYIYGGIGFGKTKSDNNNYSYLEEGNLKSYEVGFGISAFVKKNISLDIGAGYLRLKTQQDEDIFISNGFGFQAGFSFYLYPEPNKFKEIIK